MMDWRQSAKKNRDLGQSLDRRFYFDQKIFNEELNYLKQNWIPVARANSFSKPYTFKTYNILNNKIIVSSTENNDIYAYSAICSHRGALITGGSGVSKSHTCPYHSWKFDLKGDLIGAPNYDKSLCKSLHKYKCEIWQGWVFINIDNMAPPLKESVSDVHSKLDQYRLGELVPLSGKITFKGKYNWKLLVDNFGESYHVIGTHKSSIMSALDYKNSSWEKGKSYNASNYPSFNPDQTFFSPPLLTPNNKKANTCNFQIYPLLLIGLTPDFVVWIEIDIKDVEYTVTHYHILGLPEMLSNPEVSSRLDELGDSIKKIAEEDIGAYLNIGSSIRFEPYESGLLGKFEIGTANWQEWYINSMLKSFNNE